MTYINNKIIMTRLKELKKQIEEISEALKRQEGATGILIKNLLEFKTKWRKIRR